MKTAIVTGASQGLGQVIASTFAGNGWQVIGTGRSPRPDVLDGSIRYEQFDASDPKACAGFWEHLKDGLEGSEVCLVNNAGGYTYGSLLEAQPEDYQNQMQSNYFAGVYMTQSLAAVVPSARIINIVSTSALTPNSGESAYGAAKAAVMYFFRSLQKEFAPDKYRITNLYPSDIASHGANSEAIDPTDLAAFVLEQAENKTSYYITDVTLYPSSVKVS